jgi:hypothetical protein
MRISNHGEMNMPKHAKKRCNCYRCRIKRGDTYETWNYEQQERAVLESLKIGFRWVGFMPANVLGQDDPLLPEDGRETVPALMRLYKKGRVIRHRTRKYYIWGLSGYESVEEEPITHPGYFDSIDAKRNAHKPQ